MANKNTVLTLGKLRTMVAPILNHICIFLDGNVGRLVGVAEDEYDFYYVVDRIHEGRTQYSAVGSVASLKRIIPDNHYASVDRLHTSNGVPAVDDMVVIALPVAEEDADSRVVAVAVWDTILARKILRYLGFTTDPSPEFGTDARAIQDRITRMLADARAGARPQTPEFDLVAHLHRQRDFSLRTFGPGERTAGVLDHIRKELVEIEADPKDLTEWVDVVLLAIDGAWRAGHTPEEIAHAITSKQFVNEARRWPDWRTAEPGKAIEHERDAKEPKT